jgi:peroxiredoxin Q/BCP
MKTLLQPGDKAPDFEAVAVGGRYGEGRTMRLSECLGRAVVLYFYPKDDTPGCTAQACGLRDGWARIQETGAEILGVSVDSAQSHARFIAKHGLPFALVSDAAREIVMAYGVWVEKSMYGKKYMGTERTTFVIGAEGMIRAVRRKIQPAAHLSAVLEDLS